MVFRPRRVRCHLGDERAELGEDVPQLIDGGELFDIGLEEGFGGCVVERFDVGVNVAADTLEGVDEAVGGIILASHSLYEHDESTRRNVVVVYLA